MQVVCDVHIPYRLVNFLRQRGVKAVHVNKILDGCRSTDAAIADYVDHCGGILISKDGDFRDSHFLQGKPARVVRVTLGNLSNERLIDLFERHWETLQSELAISPCYIELGANGLQVFRLRQ